MAAGDHSPTDKTTEPSCLVPPSCIEASSRRFSSFKSQCLFVFPLFCFRKLFSVLVKICLILLHRLLIKSSYWISFLHCIFHIHFLTNLEAVHQLEPLDTVQTVVEKIQNHHHGQKCCPTSLAWQHEPAQLSQPRCFLFHFTLPCLLSAIAKGSYSSPDIDKTKVNRGKTGVNTQINRQTRNKLMQIMSLLPW